MAMTFARVSLAMAAGVAGYLAVAAFGGAMWKCGRLGNVWGTIVVGVTVLLVATDVVWPVTLAVPPAFVCLFPYFIGVMSLARVPSQPRQDDTRQLGVLTATGADGYDG